MDMLRRIAQLGVWSEELVTPLCVWLPGLFNPTAYLTAVMQVRQGSSNIPNAYGSHSLIGANPDNHSIKNSILVKGFTMKDSFEGLLSRPDSSF